MDPLNEKELNSLLRRWRAPETPSSLDGNVLPRRLSWWRWLMTGTIRIPVPVGVAIVLILLVWMWGRSPEPKPVAQPAASNTLADFQPVQQLEPRIIEEGVEAK